MSDRGRPEAMYISVSGFITDMAVQAIKLGDKCDEMLATMLRGNVVRRQSSATSKVYPVLVSPATIPSPSHHDFLPEQLPYAWFSCFSSCLPAAHSLPSNQGSVTSPHCSRPLSAFLGHLP